MEPINRARGMRQGRHEGMFLAQAKVRRFAEVRKSWEKSVTYGGGRKVRRIVTVENKSQNEIFTIIGVTTMVEGWSEYLGYEDGFVFHQTGCRQVYIVAKSVGRRFKALPEDIEVVKEDEGLDPAGDRGFGGA